MRQLKINKQITGRGSYAIEKYLQERQFFNCELIATNE